MSRDRILRAAMELADRHGLDALTMRRLGSELGVEAMSLYKHVANKDDILDGMLELVISEIERPKTSDGWRESMRRRAESARAALTRHSWAIGLLESGGGRGPAALAYLDAVIGVLRSAGFSLDDAAHAFWLLDSYVYGHVVQETSMSADAASRPRNGAQPDAADRYPHLSELIEHARTTDFGFDGEFTFGLELILDALERFTTDQRD